MNVDWQVSDTVRVRGKWLAPGDEVSIRGERGRMRFVKHVVNVRTGAEWIDVLHPTQGLRSFRPTGPRGVRTVHRVARLRPVSVSGRPAQVATVAVAA